MEVLPTSTLPLTSGIEFVSQPSLTWHLDRETGRIEGTCDGYDAMKQAVEIILGVERYRWQIYQPTSGMQWDGLLGQDTGFVAAELQRRLLDALLQDDRVTGLKDYSYNVNGQSLVVTFTVTTVYGDVKTGTEVMI